MKLTYPPESKPLDGYTIKRAIARGGFGEVYYALSDAGKEVAIKLLRQNLEVELRGVSQCLNLNHPNLVSIFDIRTDKQGDHWIIMEYVGGKTLDRVLDEAAGPMPMEDVQKWLGDIARGLTYLHERGLVHRDLKPANVFEHQGTIKIGDVGLSKFIADSHRDAQTQSVGTVYYMAPEVAHGRYGKPVDIYALGVMLFEMVTGQVPFDGESQAEILMKHLSEQPDLNRLPPRLRPVLARALEKDPNRRYQSAVELERDFNRAAHDILHVSSEMMDTVYNEPPPPRTYAAAMPRPAMQDRVVEPYRERPVRAARDYRYPRHGGEQSVGLGVGKYVLIGVVILAIFPRILTGSGFGKLILMGGMLVLVAFALRQLMRFIIGVPSPAYGRPIDRRPIDQPATEHQAGTVRRPDYPRAVQQRFAAIEERQEAVRQAREHRREKKMQRYQRGYVNVSPRTVRPISLRQRLSELSGSATFAALATVLITGGLVLTEFFPSVPLIALFGSITLLGSWAILTAAKALEGQSHSWGHRRLVLLAVGVLVGAAAWFVDANLFVEYNANYGPLPDKNFSVGHLDLSDAERQPTLAGYALFFAGLFGLRRWWWHADAFREKRFRLRSVFLTVLIGWLWAALVGFPILWGVTIAAALSSVVQLSASWMPLEERRNVTGGQTYV